MLQRMITGQQPGAEQAALGAASACGVPTGEAGPVQQNASESDATLWFGETTTRAANTVIRACRNAGKPFMLIYPEGAFEPSHVAAWIAENQLQILYVTGNSESEEVGLAERVERFLEQVFQQLGHRPAGA